MNINVTQGNIANQETDCIVVNLFEGVTQPGGATGVVDRALDGIISQMLATGDFKGQAKAVYVLYTQGKIAAPRVLLVGLGKAADFDLHAAREAASVAYSAIADMTNATSYATIVHGAGIGNLDARAAAQALSEGTLMGAYEAPQYRRDVEPSPLIQCTVVEYDAAKIGTITVGVEAGMRIANAVNFSRDLSSEPANILYPEIMAARAQAMADETGLTCTVLGEEQMRELNMGLLLAVCQGSEREAQMIILEHAPAGTENDSPIVFVGKGVTFDTGGISIKPTAGMWEMKDDMAGAGAVISAMKAIAELNVPRRVIGVAPCVENMPDGKAYRPGDIFANMKGKTAEIISTDAEGRLILADALGYVAQYNPRAVIDLATLTGAAVVALGSQAAALFANDDTLRDGLLAASTTTRERIWPMPLYDEYKQEIKSDMAEVKNSGGRGGGVATSAKFLEHFTEGYPWAHLDIAGVSWCKKRPNAYTPKGATGFGVRLLVEFAMNY
ncbi:MAG: leucyl aminopeptidase [Chloroflexota bacterium]